MSWCADVVDMMFRWRDVNDSSDIWSGVQGRHDVCMHVCAT